MVRKHWILVFAATLAVPALAEEPPKAAPPGTPQEEISSNEKNERAASESRPSLRKAAAPGAANMVVTKDPETGALRPATPAEREKLLGRTPLARPKERTVVTLPDGSLMVELGEADMSYAVATKGPDGSIARTCVHGSEAAAKKVAASAPAAPAAPPAPASADR